MTEAPSSLTNFKRVRPAGLLKERKPIHLLGGNLTPRQTAPKALLAMRMTCNHDNSVRFWVGAQWVRDTHSVLFNT